MPNQLDLEKSIFLQAIEHPSPAERAAFLDQACDGDPQLRAAVDSLLAAHDQPQGMLDVASRIAATVDQPVLERPGTIIGPYKLLEQIGEGGFGVVFMAEQQRPVRRKVALKVIKPGMDTRQVIARFEAERQALALMDHPNIAYVLDAGATDTGRPFFVMELVKGISITAYCDACQLTPRERLELFVNVCQAVQHAHQKGIIHRDLKPTNVLVTLHDDVPIVKVIDFGVAKATSGQLTDKTLFTGFAQMIGTPLYMSPEQAAMSGLDVDTRSDIYSLGVLLYELLTGTTPLDKLRIKGAPLDEIRRIIREEEAPTPSTRLSSLRETMASVSAQRRMEPHKLRQLLRGDLDWIVMKALEKDRTRRYATANSMAADVQRYLADEPVEARPPSAAYRFRKFARRNKTALVMGAAAGVVLLVVVGIIAGTVGWEARGRSIRRARLNSEVELALHEASAACDRALALTENPYQWEATLAAARSAFQRAWGIAGQEEAVLVPTVSEELNRVQGRLEADENDRTFVARFDEIRLEQSVVDTRLSKFKEDVAFAEVQEAFQVHYGVTFGTTRPKTVASLIRQRPKPVQEYLVAALEISQANVPKLDARIGQWLDAVIKVMDADPWRKQTRSALAARDWQVADDLLNAAIDRRQPAAILLRLTEALPPEAAATKVKLLIRIQQAYPADFWANHTLANLLQYDEHPKWEDAIRYYTGAIAVRPRNPAAHVNLGKALIGKGDLAEGVAAIRQAIRYAPDYAYAFLELGYALHQSGRLAEANEAVRQYVRLHSQTDDAHFYAGKAFLDFGLLDDAVLEFNKALEITPGWVNAHVNLGIVFDRKGEPDEAMAHNREAVRLDPENPETLNALAWQLAMSSELRIREPAKAVELAMKAVELAPKEWKIWNTLGVAQYRAGDWHAALAALGRSLELQGDNAFDWFFLAMSHWRLEQKEEARTWFAKAVAWMDKNAPDNEDLRRFRAEAEELLGDESGGGNGKVIQRESSVTDN